MQIIGHEIIHRKYPDRGWEYRAISIRVNDNGNLKDVVYGISNDKGKIREGVEIYSGSNYVVESGERSHSRRYTMSKVPPRYARVVNEAKRIFRMTKWSRESYVNRN